MRFLIKELINKKTASIILILMVIVFPKYAFAGDEIIIPFALNIEPFKKELKSKGIDLYDKDGFVENKASRVIIYTYEPTTEEQKEIIKISAFKNMRK